MYSRALVLHPEVHTDEIRKENRTPRANSEKLEGIACGTLPCNNLCMYKIETTRVNVLGESENCVQHRSCFAIPLNGIM